MKANQAGTQRMRNTTTVRNSSISDASLDLSTSQPFPTFTFSETQQLRDDRESLPFSPSPPKQPRPKTAGQDFLTKRAKSSANRMRNSWRSSCEVQALLTDERLLLLTNDARKQNSEVKASRWKPKSKGTPRARSKLTQRAVVTF